MFLLLYVFLTKIEENQWVNSKENIEIVSFNNPQLQHYWVGGINIPFIMWKKFIKLFIKWYYFKSNQ